MLKTLSEIDLGRFILSGSILLGFFLVFLTLIRSVEIPIRIYLDKRKKSNKNIVDVSEGKENKGFIDD
tara:strand:+ start:183 stop:386 length:204 start_codon:yes stop_codon:yes gene_type:complete